jgi:hypothetical protein
MRNTYTILVKKPQRKRPHRRRPTYTEGFREIECEGGKGLNWFKTQRFVNTVMNLWIP